MSDGSPATSWIGHPLASSAAHRLRQPGAVLDAGLGTGGAFDKLSAVWATLTTCVWPPRNSTGSPSSPKAIRSVAETSISPLMILLGEQVR